MTLHNIHVLSMTHIWWISKALSFPLPFAHFPSLSTSSFHSVSWTLQWRNERNGVSNHWGHDCLLNILFRRRSKKTPKLRVTSLGEGNSPVTGEFPAQRARVTRKWFHYDDVIMKSHLLTNYTPPIPLERSPHFVSHTALLWDMRYFMTKFHGPLARYVKLRLAHPPGMPRSFSPSPRVNDPQLTSSFLWSWWRGKRSQHSRRMRNPQFYVSGKRPKQHDSYKDGKLISIITHNTHTPNFNLVGWLWFFRDNWI